MAKNIMIQGTASGVGKTTIAYGLCRIFQQRGYRVAPFKALNLTSYLHQLPTGKFLARAQVLAAYAAGIEPHQDMNPLVWVPKSEGEAEYYCNGIAWTKGGYQSYLKNQRHFWQQAVAAYRRLASKYDVIIIEGAGSPVELNLSRNDIANMKVAEAFDAPVLLVADIIRGGVFASLYGTLELLSPEQRQRVVGLLVNKFMGEPELFAAGKELLEETCACPVLGVLPYMDLTFEAEDSLGCDKNNTTFPPTNLRDDLLGQERLQAEFDTLAKVLGEHIDIEKLEALIFK